MRDIKFRGKRTCEWCGGSGYGMEDGDFYQCNECNGTGQVEKTLLDSMEEEDERKHCGLCGKTYENCTCAKDGRR